MFKSNWLRALLVVPLSGLTLTLSGCGSSKDPDPDSVPGAPGKVHIHVKLGQPDSDYEQIKIVNAEDDKTLKEREIVFRDKRVVHEWFAGDGKTIVKRHTVHRDEHTLQEDFFTDPAVAGVVKEATETFPGGTIVRAHVVYDENGKLVSAEEFRSDKSLLKSLKRLTDGTVETRVMQKDGITLSSRDLAHPDESRETYNYQPDGKTLASLIERRADGTKKTSLYRNDGKRLFSVEDESYQGSETTYYWTDGKTVRAVASRQGYSIRSIVSNKQDGTLDHTREYSPAGDTMTVVSYAGKPPVARFKQSWQKANTYWWETKYSLSSVETYRADGKTVDKFYEYYSDGTTLQKLTINNSDGTKSVRSYRATNGTLEKEDFYDAKGTLTKTEPTEEAKNVRENVDAALTTVPAFDDPSAWNEPRD